MVGNALRGHTDESRNMLGRDAQLESPHRASGAVRHRGGVAGHLKRYAAVAQEAAHPAQRRGRLFLTRGGFPCRGAHADSPSARAANAPSNATRTRGSKQTKSTRSMDGAPASACVTVRTATAAACSGGYP